MTEYLTLKKKSLKGAKVHLAFGFRVHSIMVEKLTSWWTGGSGTETRRSQGKTTPKNILLLAQHVNFCYSVLEFQFTAFILLYISFLPPSLPSFLPSFLPWYWGLNSGPCVS
jgi:hypothetical protein